MSILDFLNLPVTAANATANLASAPNTPPVMTSGDPSLNMMDPLAAAGLQQNAQAQNQGAQFAQGLQLYDPQNIPGGLNLPVLNPPTPPQRPAAGAGLQAFNNSLKSGNNVPLPPPRPQNIQANPTATQLLSGAGKNGHGLFNNLFGLNDPNWNAKQHGLLANMGHTFGMFGSGLSNLFGGGQASTPVQGVSSDQQQPLMIAAAPADTNPLAGIFSGLFGS